MPGPYAWTGPGRSLGAGALIGLVAAVRVGGLVLFGFALVLDRPWVILDEAWRLSLGWARRLGARARDLVRMPGRAPRRG